MNANMKDLILVNTGRSKTEITDENKWIAQFREEREFDRIKENTIKSDISRLKVFLAYCKKLDKEPDTLNRSEFTKFFNYLENERKLGNSVIQYFKLLKVFYRVLRLHNFKEFETECKERRRFSKFEVKHYDSIDSKILNEILKAILQHRSRSNLRDALMIRMLWDTGCRVSEVIGITYEDCDFKEAKFRIRNTKSSNERFVVCSSDTLNALKEYVKYNVNTGNSDPIFQSIRGGPVRRGWLSQVYRNAVVKLKEQGKIPKNRRVVVHSLRHGRAVELLNKGVPIEVVKEYLGHSSIETTLFYAHSKERTNILLNTIKKNL
ncbi:integrase/recombinase XerD [Methanococcus voltae]|uniref:tyrosine-type recombinase/integrase n=1 Tax=Methanococcus voltae TaxID=2188 RepID=UPI001AE9536F|nr:site-specific integrase [Methanococcus voltae]MBP2143814.1 integrase/recombinase XerD [Methanococcus voltae]